jgi:hypothetical protein
MAVTISAPTTMRLSLHILTRLCIIAVFLSFSQPCGQEVVVLHPPLSGVEHFGASLAMRTDFL